MNLLSVNGVTLYEGPSRITGEPVALIATGLSIPTSNPKTPHCVTVWGISSNTPPSIHIKQGAESTCGNCPILSECYVGGYALASVYRAYKSGKYPRLGLERLPELMRRGYKLRLGGYGNPSIVGWRQFGAIIPNLGVKWLSYEHDWQSCPASWRRVSMASTENISGTLAAHSRGWRAYQVAPVNEGSAMVHKLKSHGLRAVLCPYDKNDRRSINCHNCPHPCDGKISERDRRPHIVAEIHGSPSIVEKRNQALRVLQG